jgi:hypothetical protein
MRPDLRLRLGQVEPPTQSGQTPKPSHQCLQIRTVLFTHCFEFQSQSAAGLHMPHYSVGSNLALLDKKMKIGRRAYALYLGGFKEQPSRAEIYNAGQIAISITFPVDPDVPPGLDP